MTSIASGGHTDGSITRHFKVSLGNIYNKLLEGENPREFKAYVDHQTGEISFDPTGNKLNAELYVNAERKVSCKIIYQDDVTYTLALNQTVQKLLKFTLKYLSFCVKTSLYDVVENTKSADRYLACCKMSQNSLGTAFTEEEVEKIRQKTTYKRYVPGELVICEYNNAYKLAKILKVFEEMGYLKTEFDCGEEKPVMLTTKEIKTKVCVPPGPPPENHETKPFIRADLLEMEISDPIGALRSFITRYAPEEEVPGEQPYRKLRLEGFQSKLRNIPSIKPHNYTHEKVPFELNERVFICRSDKSIVFGVFEKVVDNKLRFVVDVCGEEKKYEDIEIGEKSENEFIFKRAHPLNDLSNDVKKREKKTVKSIKNLKEHLDKTEAMEFTIHLDKHRAVIVGSSALPLVQFQKEGEAQISDLIEVKVKRYESGEISLQPIGVNPGPITLMMKRLAREFNAQLQSDAEKRGQKRSAQDLSSATISS